MNPPDFDIAAAHRHFSASCFNGVWELIDKPHRSSDEDRLMVSMCHASLYHWRQRPIATRAACRSATGSFPACMPCWERPTTRGSMADSV